MSNIVSSTFQESVQVDGRSIVSEVHTDLIGVMWDVSYLADAKADLKTEMVQHAVDLGNNIASAEIADNINQIMQFGSAAKLNFNYSSVKENLEAVRDAYGTATKMDAVMMGEYLSALDDADLQTVFKSEPVKTLRDDKLNPAALTAASIKSAVGQ